MPRERTAGIAGGQRGDETARFVVTGTVGLFEYESSFCGIQLMVEGTR
jgi:hypothetical protein